MNPFAYEWPEPDIKLILRRSNSRYTLYNASFTSAARSRLIGTDEAPGEYYLPRASGPVPLVILLHGMGDTSLVPPRFLARSLVTAGFACFVPRLVVHSTRTPKIGNRSCSLSPDEWFDAYRDSVIEVRQIVDWAQKRTELDRRKIAVLGISFGGFVSAITMGVEKRISAGILIETGGNSIKINQLSRAMRTRYPGPALDYENLLKEYNEYLAQVGEHGSDRIAPTYRSFMIDPLTYTSSIKTRPLLMINALEDELIPRQSALELWKETGKQTLIWLPGTHVTLWLWYLVISHKVKAFIKSVFGNNACVK